MMGSTAVALEGLEQGQRLGWFCCSSVVISCICEGLKAASNPANQTQTLLTERQPGDAATVVFIPSPLIRLADPHAPLIDVEARPDDVIGARVTVGGDVGGVRYDLLRLPVARRVTTVAGAMVAVHPVGDPYAVEVYEQLPALR